MQILWEKYSPTIYNAVRMEKHYKVFRKYKFYFRLELITASKQFRKVYLHRYCHKQGYMKAGGSLGTLVELCWRSLRFNWYSVCIQMSRETAYEAYEEHMNSYCGYSRLKQGRLSFTKTRMTELFTWKKHRGSQGNSSFEQEEGAGPFCVCPYCSCWVGTKTYIGTDLLRRFWRIGPPADTICPSICRCRIVILPPLFMHFVYTPIFMKVNTF